MIQIDFFTIFIGTCLGLVIYSLWFSPWLFGTLWENATSKVHPRKKKKWATYIGMFFLQWILAYCLAVLEVYIHATTFWDGILLGIFIWTSFFLIPQVASFLWKKQPFRVILIELGYWLAVLVTISGMIAG